MPNSNEINELRAELHALRAEVAALKRERVTGIISDTKIVQTETEDSAIDDVIEQPITDESESMTNEPVLEVEERENEGITGYKVAHIVVGIVLIILGSFLSYKSLGSFINYAYDSGFNAGNAIGYDMTYNCDEPANTTVTEYKPLDDPSRGKGAFWGD